MSSLVNISEKLSSKEINPTMQRIKIYEYLYENKTHPTVDTVFVNVHKEFPTLSKATVYNTLNLFVEKNLIQEISIEGKESRYDYNTVNHGHFKCKTCGGITDFNITKNVLNDTNIKDFIIEEQHIYIKGVCEKCIK